MNLTVLSFGGGQDSTALLMKYVYDPLFKDEFVKGDFMVVMSDTGNEHYETYEHVGRIMIFCGHHKIRFAFIRPEHGYHPKTWQSLTEQYALNNAIQSVAFPKSCTDNLKIKPIYGFLADYVNEMYLNSKSTPYRKKSLYEFTERHGKIRMLLGIAYGEESRVADESKILSKWMRECVERVYPLIDIKMDRQGCQDYISSTGNVVPAPSNCMFCPFLSKLELLWLFNHHPDRFDEWVMYERNKINKFSGIENNLGVFGKKLLPEVLAIAQEKYSHMTEAEIDEYKFSHGHCVKTKY